MPQLDSVTFLSQFFWLCIVFSGLYLILVKFCLPSIARILKVRELIQQENISGSNKEQAKVSSIDSKNFSVAKKCFANYPAFEFETKFLSDAQNLQFTNQFATNYQKMLIANLVLSRYGRAKNKSFAQANSMITKGTDSASQVFYYKVLRKIKNSKRIIRKAGSSANS
jgi:hypothetical protein